jgi:hypothetical protein
MSLSTITWPQSTGAGVVVVSNGVPGAGVVTGGAVVFLAVVAGVDCRIGIVVGRAVVFGLVMEGVEGRGGANKFVRHAGDLDVLVCSIALPFCLRRARNYHNLSCVLLVCAFKHAEKAFLAGQAVDRGQPQARCKDREDHGGWKD